MTFKDGVDVLGTGELDGYGEATLKISSLSLGEHTITAEYEGDGYFGGSVSEGLPHTVNKADSATTLASAPNPSKFGQPVAFMATVAGFGGGVPTGDVNFLEDGEEPPIGSPTLRAQVCSPPAAIALTPLVSPLTSTGSGWFTPESSPSRPFPLAPQHLTPPASVSAQV